MPYKNVAVIGAGTIGTPIAKALLQEGANVIVLSRPASASGKDLPAEVKVVPVDYADVSTLAALFKEHGTEVVISTVGAEVLGGLQKGLGDAAKQGGVKLFVPSEFGFDTIKHTKGGPSLGTIKAELAAHLKNIGLPSARIFTGLFTTYIPWMLNVNSGSIHLIGKGDKKFSTTHPDDIAGFLAYILTHLPESELHDKAFRIEGARVTLNDVIGFYHDGSKYPIEHVDVISDNAQKNTLQLIIDSDIGVVVEEGAASSNALWAGHAWKGIKEGLGL
ncbi:NAD(P)-binding protein [Athelia psychrophila]|uniref:NAD(P)-binding protein n=1 Tax=Athelia psychrophila TaxID=1759441 RepID=A0A166UHH0_9AGAM|nr:NAD(P)-binding protein [Fibularhizoctonia sp. CBS 109695]